MELRWLRMPLGEFPSQAARYEESSRTWLELQYRDGEEWKPIPVVHSEGMRQESLRRAQMGSEMGSLAGLYGVGKNGGVLSAESLRMKDQVDSAQMAPPWNPKPWWKIW